MCKDTRLRGWRVPVISDSSAELLYTFWRTSKHHLHGSIPSRLTNKPWLPLRKTFYPDRQIASKKSPEHPWGHLVSLWRQWVLQFCAVLSALQPSSPLAILPWTTDCQHAPSDPAEQSVPLLARINIQQQGTFFQAFCKHACMHACIWKTVPLTECNMSKGHQKVSRASSKKCLKNLRVIFRGKWCQKGVQECLEHVEVVDPIICAQGFTNELSQRRVAECQPSPRSDPVCLVLELFWPYGSKIFEDRLLDDVAMYSCNAIYCMAGYKCKVCHSDRPAISMTELGCLCTALKSLSRSETSDRAMSMIQGALHCLPSAKCYLVSER